MTYTGRNLLASRTEAPGANLDPTLPVPLAEPVGEDYDLEAVMTYFYNLDRTQAAVVDGRDHRTDFIYEACCKRRFATIEPTLEDEPGQPRPGRLTISDPHGNTVYSAVVADTSLGLSEHL